MKEKEPDVSLCLFMLFSSDALIVIHSGKDSLLNMCHANQVYAIEERTMSFRKPNMLHMFFLEILNSSLDFKPKCVFEMMDLLRVLWG